MRKQVRHGSPDVRRGGLPDSDGGPNEATHTLRGRSILVSEIVPCIRKSGGVLKLDDIDEVDEVAGDGCVEDEDKAEYMLEEPEAALLEVDAPLVVLYGWVMALRWAAAFPCGYR